MVSGMLIQENDIIYGIPCFAGSPLSDHLFVFQHDGLQ